jgi:hypothetical protein
VRESRGKTFRKALFVISTQSRIPRGVLTMSLRVIRPSSGVQKRVFTVAAEAGSLHGAAGEKKVVL